MEKDIKGKKPKNPKEIWMKLEATVYNNYQFGFFSGDKLCIQVRCEQRANWL
jgi:hypothetical protein